MTTELVHSLFSLGRSLWSAATSKYPRCLHPAGAEKWAGEAGIKRLGRLQHAFTAACQTDTEHKRDKSLHYLWKWLNHQEKPAPRPPGTWLHSKLCFLLCGGKETSFHPIFWCQKLKSLTGAVIRTAVLSNASDCQMQMKHLSGSVVASIRAVFDDF